MADIQLQRTFGVSVERLFEVVTSRRYLLEWIGHDGMTKPEDDLDFSREGPWFVVMQGADGTRYKVSGQVTHVRAPSTVGFTWGWHDPDDKRGSESHVIFTVQPVPQGAQLTIDHCDLDDSPQSQRHLEGWTASVERLGALVS